MRQSGIPNKRRQRGILMQWTVGRREQRMRHLQHFATRFLDVTVGIVNHGGLHIGEDFGRLRVLTRGINLFEALDVKSDFAFEVTELGLIQPTHLIDKLLDGFLLFHGYPRFP